MTLARVDWMDETEMREKDRLWRMLVMEMV